MLSKGMLTIMFTKYLNELTGESYLQTIYNGLNIIVIPKKDFKSQYAVYATNYGSINNHFRFKNKEHKVPDGIAHFLEHKMFESEDGDAFSRYAKTGACANAFTSFNNTAYLFSSTNNFYESLKILVDLVNSPYFTAESVKKEQGIIGQEIQMGLDNPGNQCFYNLLKCLFRNNSVRNDIAGSIESISQITPELLYTCYDAFYNPSNMVLCVCGNIDENRVLEVVSKGMRDTVPEKVENINIDEPDSVYEPEKIITAEVSQPIFEFGIKDSFIGKGRDIVMHRIIIDIILDAIAGKSTDFYMDLYNKGLINNSFGTEVMCYDSCGMIGFGGESQDPARIYSMLRDEIDKVTNTGIDEAVFTRLKNKNYGIVLNSFDNPDELSNAYASLFFDNVPFLDIIDIYKGLSLDQVNASLKYFDTSKMASSVVNPRK